MINGQWSMVNDQWSMVNTPTLARGLAGLVSNKELLYNTWRGICHVVGKANWLSCERANWLSCWRANCNSPLHVWHNAGIRYLLVTFFTFHHIPKLIRLATFFTLHSSPHTQAHSLGYTFHSSFFILHSLYHCSSSERGILRGGWRHSTEPVRASGASSWGLVPSLR